MEYQQFFDAVKLKLPVKTVLQNPGRGISTIQSYSESQLVYKRGKSNIPVDIHAFYDAYQKFSGKKVTTTDLKEYNPKVFDSKSNGHSCNCTMLFMILKVLEIITAINGTGKRGDPFWIYIPDLPQ